MWKRAETGQTNLDFQQVLAECADYTPVLTNVMAGLQRPGHVLWYWSGQGFRLALAYRITDRDCMIVVGVPSPEGVPAQWAKVMIRKLRVELDALGITDWRAKQNEVYQSEHMADFAYAVTEICHEAEGETIRHGKRELVFKRRPEKKHLDEQFQGKDHGRPPRKKTPQ